MWINYPHMPTGTPAEISKLEDIVSFTQKNNIILVNDNPYSQILNEYKIIPGISNLHFRFGHVSIFQYLSSFNYTFFSELNGLLVPPALFCITIFLYFLSKQNAFNSRNAFLHYTNIPGKCFFG